jgi:ABC-type amino acid transport substrate-binding protein
MVKFFCIVSFVISSLFCVSQNADTLFVNYFSQAGFAVYDDGKATGVEMEILNEYVAWLKTSKNIDLSVKYVKFANFSAFYSSIKTAPKNTVGLGSVTIMTSRSKEIDFTAPYLKNTSFFVTNGNALDIKDKKPDAIVRALGNMTALTLTNTTLNDHVNDIKKLYIKDLKIIDKPNEVKILDEISRNVLYFGYVDAISFWVYLKYNPTKFLKIQKVLNQPYEELGFILPKGSQHKALFDEFFNGPSGFKKTKKYIDILEKCVGAFMSQSMAIK